MHSAFSVRLQAQPSVLSRVLRQKPFEKRIAPCSRGFFDRDLPIEKSEDAVSILKIITSAVFLQKNRQFRTELPTCCTILPFCAPYIIQHPRESLPKLCFTLRATLLLDGSACDFGAVRVSCSAFPPNDFVRPKGHSSAKRRNYRNCPKNIDKIGKV